MLTQFLVQNLNFRSRVTSHDSLLTSHESRVTSLEPRVTTHDLKIHNLGTSWGL